MGNEVAALGVGMHPWGKWGRNFVEYGVHAIKAALKDADVDWKDVEFVAGGETVRNGYPGYVAGATFAKAMALPTRCESHPLRTCRSGAAVPADCRSTFRETRSVGAAFPAELAPR